MSTVVRVVTPAPVEPITVQQAKDWIGEDLSEQDAVIGILISAMRQYLENYTRRAFVMQKLQLLLECWPSCVCIKVPRPPLQSVDEIRYMDTNGDWQVLDTSIYEVDTYSEPGRIQPAYNQVWPPIRYGVFHPVRVTYWAGYFPGSPVDNASYLENIPPAAKQWMQIRIGMLYEIRHAIMENGWQVIPRDHLDGLLDSLIVELFG